MFIKSQRIHQAPVLFPNMNRIRSKGSPKCVCKGSEHGSMVSTIHCYREYGSLGNRPIVLMCVCGGREGYAVDLLRTEWNYGTIKI